MKVEEKSKLGLKQDQDNKHQTKKNITKNEEIEGLELEKQNKTELSNDKKVKELEEKILRNLAEMENQRRRFEKERQEAFEFGGFNFAKESLSLLDNID